jgi:hypothetical protein
VSAVNVADLNPDRDCIALTPCDGYGPCGGDGCTWPSVASSDECCQVEPDADPVAELPVPPFRAGVCGRCYGVGTVTDVPLTQQLREQTGRPLSVIERCPSCGGSGGMIARST